MKTVEDWKELITGQPWVPVETFLSVTVEKINFLEDIYKFGGKHNRFSDQFKQAAVREREELCKVTSACHMILRERGGKS